MSKFEIGKKLPKLVDAVLDSYRCDPLTRHIGQRYFPSNSEITQLIDKLLELVYPGFVGRQDLNEHNIGYHVGELLPQVGQLAYKQIHRSLIHDEMEIEGEHDLSAYDERAAELTLTFLESLPNVRDVLADDVQAALDGDPAAENVEEIILAYPGMLAVTVYRIAHELCKLRIPLMPRVMSEWAHRETGVDIHPGARIGRSFFIDHGTGVVVGETTDIGEHVKIYQGVTLGALSFPKDDSGKIIRVAKRHPTVEDHVTIYANAIILGGETVIGAHSVVGGSVFLTTSVPPWSTVTITPPDLRVKTRNGPGKEETTEQRPIALDFQI